MRRGLGGYKRRHSSRRSSHGARGRSVSPVPSVGARPLPDSDAAGSRSPLTGLPRKASTAPSSPHDSVLPVGPSVWEEAGQRSGLPSQQGGASTAAAGAGNSEVSSSASSLPPPPSSTVPLGPPSRAQQQEQPARGGGFKGQGETSGVSGTEPTMGTIFTEWFQKLFAHNDGSNSHGGSALAGGDSKSSSRGRMGNKTARSGAGSAMGYAGSGGSATGDSTPARASGEEGDTPSNKTSAASDFVRPQSPTQTTVSPSPAAATAATDAVTSYVDVAARAAEEGDPIAAPLSTNGDATLEAGGLSSNMATSDGVQGNAGEADPSSSTAVAATTSDAVHPGAGGERQQQEHSGAKDDNAGFLGIFTRGFGVGSNKDGSDQGKEVNAHTSVAPESGITEEERAARSAAAGAPGEGGTSLPPNFVEAAAAAQPIASTGGGATAAAEDASSTVGASAHPADIAVNSSEGAARAVGGSGGSSPTPGAAGASGTGEARGTARGEGGVGTASRSTSPSRSQTLSVGSDDGEEENLYTAGTHQGAKPSIDDFSSLRVLGKGSYGKVVLVRRKSTGVLYAMKILKKGDVVRKRQVERTKIERRVLGNVEHPFLMRLHYAFQTDNKLYLVLDYCPGGELFFHLSRYKRFPEGVVRFYAAELVLALKHLHDNNIIYRDIKPENILLDADGHIKLGDFGLAKDNVSDSTFGAQSVCGTPEYMAPEVINKAGHGTAVDWWGLGMLMYEMLTGLPPWYTKDRQKLFERLRGAPLVIPKNVSAPSASIIGGLLTRNPSKRLGTLGALQVMHHEFFRGLDWAALLAKRIPAPLNPCRNERQGSESTHNFDPQFTRMPIDTMSLGGGIVSPGPDGHFDGFTYEIPGVILEGEGGDR